MTYVIDRINQGISERLAERLSPAGKWLVIDFLESGFPSDDIGDGCDWRRISLVEEGGLERMVEFTEGEFQGVLLNLQIAWFDHQQVFDALSRVISPGGHIFFSTLGPDTLFELNEAWMAVDDRTHVHSYPDIQQLGDQLIRSGYSRPILDADWFGVHYDDIDLLMDDLRVSGFHNTLANRRKSLTGKGRMQRLRDIFTAQGAVQITFELIYGYARVAEKNSQGVRVALPQR